MATHSRLLAAGWAGQDYTLNGEEFGADDSAFAGALAWRGTLPKPTLQDLEARRAEIEAAIALARRQADQRKTFDQKDALLLAVKVLAGAIAEMQAKLRAQSLTSPLSAASQNQIDTLLERIAQIEALP